MSAKWERWLGGRRGKALLLVKIAVSGALLAVLLARIGLRPLLEVIGRASPSALCASALILLASHGLGCWLWGRLLVVVGVTLPVRRVIGYYFAGNLLNLVLPGGVSGDMARVLGAGQEGGSRSGVVGATLVERVLGGAALGLLGLAALPGAGSLLLAPRGGLLAAVVIVYSIASVLALWLVLGPGGRRLLRIIRKDLPAGIAERLQRVEEALKRLGNLGGLERASLFMTAILIQTARILAHAQVARALDIHVELRYFFLFVPLLAIAVSLPISVGGIGVRETLGALLFGLLGLDAARASGMQLLGYLVATLVSIPGVVLLANLGSRSSAKGQGSPR